MTKSWSHLMVLLPIPLPRSARTSSTPLIGPPRSGRRGRTRPGDPGVCVDRTSTPSCPKHAGGAPRFLFGRSWAMGSARVRSSSDRRLASREHNDVGFDLACSRLGALERLQPEHDAEAPLRAQRGEGRRGRRGCVERRLQVVGNLRALLPIGRLPATVGLARCTCSIPKARMRPSSVRRVMISTLRCDHTDRGRRGVYTCRK